MKPLILNFEDNCVYFSLKLNNKTEAEELFCFKIR